MVAVSQDDCCPLEDGKLLQSNPTHFSLDTEPKARRLSESLPDLAMSQTPSSSACSQDCVTNEAEINSLSSPTGVKEELWKYVEPPDVGYSWVVLSCCVILQFSVGVLSASNGLFYVEWIEDFQMGEGVTSWISATQQSILFVMAPVIGFMAEKIGDRNTVMIGSIGAGLSSAVASISTSYEALFITYGVLAGFFKGCILIPTTVASARYFRKYRVLALTISTCGFPLVYMIVSPIMAELIQLYGWRIANTCSACVVVECAVFAALLRPQREVKAAPTEQEFDSLTSTSFRKGSYSSRRSLEGSLMEEYTDDKDCEHKVSDCPAKKWHETSQEAKLSNQTDDSLLSDSDIDNPETDKVKPLLKTIVEHPLCHWRMAILLASNFTWGWSASAMYVLLPDHARSRGINTPQVGQLLMIIGGLGFGGRLGTVIFCRLVKTFRKGAAVLISTAVQAAALLGLSLAHTFAGLALMAAVHAAAFGISTCLATPLILEMHGDGHLALVFSLEMFLYGLGSYLSAPFAAYNVDILGSYEFGFQFAAAMTLLGGLLFVPHILVQVVRGRKKDDNV